MSRRNNDNVNLFWYGVWANVKKGFGALLSMFGFVVGLFGLTFESGVTGFFGLVLIVLGIWLMISGASQRFDYKRQSGSLIHRGDW